MNPPVPPLVGVIMTAHNSDDYIAIALDSLIAQSYQTWECVVIDDGSTDATTEVVEKYAGADARIRLIRQQQTGVSGARNAGLAALGPDVEYVAFLDSDDTYLPDALQALTALLNSRPDAVGVYGLAEYMDGAGDPIRLGEHSELQHARRTIRRLGLDDVAVGSDSTFADISVAGAIWPSAVGLHRRTIIDAVGRFDISFIRQGDWELYVRMSRRGPFPVLDQQVCWYRRHESNLTGDFVETRYQQARVRRKAWSAAENTPEQRQIVARGARRLQLVDIRRMIDRLNSDIRRRRLSSAAADLVGLLVMGANLCLPGPARPSRSKLHWSRRDRRDPLGSR